MIRFPVKKYKYYNTLCTFIKDIFETVNYKVTLDNNLHYYAPGIFEISINGKIAVIDLSDFKDEYRYDLTKTGVNKTYKVYEPENINAPIFKRIYRPETIYNTNILPLGLFYPAGEYLTEVVGGRKNNLLKSDVIIHTNNIYAGAIFTRKKAFALLNESKLNKNIRFDREKLDLKSHLNRLEKCLGMLQISGASNYTLDPGHCMALMKGVCLISNDCDVELPYSKSLRGGEHYILVKQDYSNINECINYVYDNKKECQEISYNAYQLASITSTPVALSKWLIKQTELFYE